MNVLRSLMLVGSLGKVWARTRVGRNIFSSISIMAYFKLLDDYENGVSTNIVIIPGPPHEVDRQKPPLERPRTNSVQRHRERLKQTMRNVNRVINDY